MIAYLKGIVTHRLVEAVYVNVHDVGYRVYVPSSVQSQLQVGEETCLYTYTNVREDAIQLYGFLTIEDYELFLMLISVSGVGPKLGLGILSAISPDQFVGLIISGDTKGLQKLPGIGKKSAERLVLELKDKIESLGIAGTFTPGGTISALVKAPVGVTEEVVEALMALGYSAQEVQPVVQDVYDGTQEVPELLKQVLAALGKGR
ncbi:Holliday junction branch migration protein RuvA [Veillonella sp. CHU110]|uniref:Holliday junction branch migration protein RuvA n=1 Tax=Veillonella sp. CHU110 TaxID=2490947 RepID=UPI000F8E0E64|nr:Holliday junction branch migration protein RuvA [Veillonella sp. CHU110]